MSDFDVGTVATYVCNPGFTLNGDRTRVCQSDRMFDGMDPICSLVRK